MGFNDVSWRKPGHKPLSSVRPLQAIDGRFYVPNGSLQIPQGVRTLAPSGKPQLSKFLNNGALATLAEDGSQSQAAFRPGITHNSTLRASGTSNVIPASSNEAVEENQQQRWFSNMFRNPRPAVQRVSSGVSLLKHEFERGMIINAPLFQEDRRHGRHQSSNISLVTHGIVHSKARFMIIVGLNHTSYTTVSLYTHEHKGLCGKENYKHEYISVRDGRIPPRNFKRQSDYKELVTDGTGARIHEMSTAWLTNPVSRDYDLSIQCHGRLTAASTQRLLQLVQEVTAKSLGL